MTIAKRIYKFKPCDEAVEWLGKRSSPERAWRQCERGDWLLWIACQLEVRTQLAAIACAETALVYVSEHETWPKEAVRLINRFEFRKAADWVNRIMGRASTAASADAAWAMNCALHTPLRHHYTIHYAVRAAACTAVLEAPKTPIGAKKAAATRAAAEAHAKCVRIVRKSIPWEVVNDAIRNC